MGTGTGTGRRGGKRENSSSKPQICDRSPPPPPHCGGVQSTCMTRESYAERENCMGRTTYRIYAAEKRRKGPQLLSVEKPTLSPDQVIRKGPMGPMP
ncbi:hypothetical protein GW17_00036895 [Ensete ventricosum]|nr:hypothetical protein GW17_00036895 [Ensete ventricosum]